jgi:hypothetical protein
MESIEDDHGSSLPPTDGGKDAWLFLLASFMLEALIWGNSSQPLPHFWGSRKLILSGFPACYGVFQKYYGTHEPFAGSKNIAVVGACAMVLFLRWHTELLLTDNRGSCTWNWS